MCEVHCRACSPVPVRLADVVVAREDAARQLGMHGNPTADVVHSTPVEGLGQASISQRAVSLLTDGLDAIAHSAHSAL